MTPAIRRGYEFTLMNPVYHNGEFSHNNVEHQTIVAETEKEATAVMALRLKQERKMVISPELTITVGYQHIYSVKCLGREVYEVVIRYEPEPES